MSIWSWSDIRNGKFPEEPLKSEYRSIILTQLQRKFSVLIFVYNQAKKKENLWRKGIFSLNFFRLISNKFVFKLFVQCSLCIKSIYSYKYRDIHRDIFTKFTKFYIIEHFFFFSHAVFFCCDLRLRRRPNQIKKIERGKIY
jgi:hypothetical protein